MWVCSHCQSRNRDREQFCPKCGQVKVRDSYGGAHSGSDPTGRLGFWEKTTGILTSAVLLLALVFAVVLVVMLFPSREAASSTVWEPPVKFTPEPDPEPIWEATPAPAPVPTLVPTPVPTPEPAPELTARVSSSTGNYDRLDLLSAYASSELYSDDTRKTYYAVNAVDGDDSTCWQEGADGTGIGEYIEVYLFQEVKITALTFRMGYAAQQTYYEHNGRPSMIEIRFSDGQSVICSFPDENAEFVVSLSHAVAADSFTVTILDIYEGSLHEDTCITEISAIGG